MPLLWSFVRVRSMELKMIQFTDAEFYNLTSFVKVNYGIDLSNKKTFAELRLQRLIEEHGFDNFTAYFNYVTNDMSGIAISDFISRLTVNHTLFFRESYHFDYLNEMVLPYFFEKAQDTREFRVWSAGCSTGEEPYTLAMIISDFLGIYKAYWDMRILATDVSEFALKKAITASYSMDSINDLNPRWMKEYFTRDPNNPDHVFIADKIKDEIIFRKHNLIGDKFHFKNKFHFIFCRNVMIYFDEPTRNALINRFYENLEDGGYLFIGMSETISKSASDFKYVMPSVYRKELETK